jgi:drug/metabolite transporter (DMT)-like permease
VRGLASSIWGFAAVLVAAFLYGVTNILAKTLKPIFPLSSGTAAFICSGVVSVSFAFWMDRPFEVLANDVSMESFVSLNNYLVPLVGIGWGVGLLGEAATWNSIAALGLIFAGIAVTNMGANRRVVVEAAD